MATSVDAKLLKQTKFPPEFSRKVDMTKVNIEVMKKCVAKAPAKSLIARCCYHPGLELTLLNYCRWIAGKISEILGNEDDVVIELCFNLLEGSRFVCTTFYLLPSMLICYVLPDVQPSKLTGFTLNYLSPISSPCRFSSPDSLIKILASFARSCGRYV